MRLEIKNRFTDEVIFNGDAPSIAALLEEAVALEVDLAEARLAGENLSKANLSGARLALADLSKANLSACEFDRGLASGRCNVLRRSLRGKPQEGQPFRSRPFGLQFAKRGSGMGTPDNGQSIRIQSNPGEHVWSEPNWCKPFRGNTKWRKYGRCQFGRCFFGRHAHQQG